MERAADIPSSQMSDCFAYAMARNLRVPLLFKGDDFPKTHIESAV